MTVDLARIHAVAEWLVGEMLADTRLKDIVPDLAGRLAALDVPVHRCRLTWPTLHPLFEAETLLWTDQDGATGQRFDRDQVDDTAWRQSTVKWMLDTGATMLRANLMAPATPEFPLYDDMRGDGFVDFLALRTQLFADGSLLRQGSTNSDFGLYVAWATRHPGGFSADAVEILNHIQLYVAMLCKTLAMPRLIIGVANTYLGPTIAREVLGGRITLGSGSQVRALIWYSDLRNSTGLAESMGSEAYLALLNDYFDCTGRAVVEAGGEILAFVGDAVLAILPIGAPGFTEHEAALRGMRAADAALAAAASTNARRSEAGAPAIEFGIAMCVGEVRLGNIGIRQRLSFSVIGPSANEVERLEKMTKTLRVNVLATQDVAEAAPHRWQAMGHVPLRGFRDTVPVFSLTAPEAQPARH